MISVMQEIINWAGDLPYWEQAVLDKILCRSEFTEEDYSQLIQYMLEDAQIVEKASERQQLRFQPEISEDSDEKKPVLLSEISNLTNVNALVPGQRLTFNPRLTAIFGRNGSGKSGYARVLGCAGFTRGDKKVLPDVTKPQNMNGVMTADITLDENGQKRTFTYQVGKTCSEMSSFYAFDSTSVQVHMKGKNTFSFSPAGLHILTELGKVTDEVRNRLKAQIAEKEQASDLVKYFSGTSEITTLIEDLNAESDLNGLAELAKLSTKDKKRIDELNIVIGKIGLEIVNEDIVHKEQDLATLQRLNSWLIKAQAMLSDQAIKDVEHTIDGYVALEKQVMNSSIEQFTHKRLSQTGTDLWHEFVRVARQLAEAESKDTQYPQDRDVCLLCQQTLSNDAQQLILKLWAHLDGELRRDFEASKAEILNKGFELRGSNGFDLGEDLSPAIDLLQVSAPDLSTTTRGLIREYHQRGAEIEHSLMQKKLVGKVAPLPADPGGAIRVKIQQMEEEIDKLKKEDLRNKREKLEKERCTLEHRKRLGELYPDIEAYVNGCVWARKASKIGGSTRHITDKHNQLFNNLVKDRYIEIFEQVLEDLGRPLQVEIATTGSKGKTLKQVVLRAHDSAKNIADPETVLSEGEKRAVALADFLTEVALDTTNSGIILDDPVTSLDLEWRKTIAKILAKEVEKRQVIVFTHDMPFLYLLLNFADEIKLDKQVHWIKRGEIDDKPGYVWLNNCPALESEYKKPTLAEQCCKDAIVEPEPQKQQRILKDGCGALRSSYEALIVFELLNGVVLRFDERISFGRLEEIAWDPIIVNDIVRTCERLSRYIEGHLHSDALEVDELTAKLLKEEIDTFYKIRSRIRALKN